MKAVQLMLLCLGIAVAASCQNQTPTDFVKKMDSLVNEAWNMGIFSGVVGIAKEGRIIYTKKYGYADWDTKKPLNENTLFDIGSINKRFTQEMIHQLANEGKISYSDPLSKYLNLFSKEINDKITIQQLIDMTSGLGDYLNLPGFGRREKEGGLTIQDRLEAIKQQPLLYEPGKGKEYSNSGYVVLGAIIEKATGKSYKENLEERILKPLKLNNVFYTKEDIRSNKERAIGTNMNFKGEKKSVDDVWSDASPDGGLYATLADLMSFAWASQNGLLPSGKKYPMQPIAGGSNYWNSVIIPFEDATTVIVMSNMQNIADEVGMRIYAIGKGKTPKPLQISAEHVLYSNLKQKGISYIEENIHDIVKSFGLPYDDRFLNFYGYRFMQGNDVDAALQLFELNTRLFPKVANTYDSLAEAWLKKGDKEQAIRFYKKALEVDPNSTNAKEMLKKIES